MKFVKIFRENEIHHSFAYQEGYNTEINFDKSIICDKGLHFCEEKYIFYWFRYGNYNGHYREVITSVKCIEGYVKYKAKTIFVGPKKKFTEKMKLAAVKQNEFVIRFIENPTKKVCLEAIKKQFCYKLYKKSN